MAKQAMRTKVLEVSPEVEELFQAVESFIYGTMRSASLGLKIQVEKDFRGKPALTLRIREQNLEAPEIMDAMRYPQ